MHENLINFREFLKNSKKNIAHNSNEISAMKEDIKRMLKDETATHDNPKLQNSITEIKLNIANLYNIKEIFVVNYK